MVGIVNRPPLKRSQKPIRKRRKVKKSSLRYEVIFGAIRRYPDGREVFQNNGKGIAERLRRKMELLLGESKCEACGAHVNDEESELSHRTGKGIGGSKEDSRMANLMLLHTGANRAQGSMPFDYYMKNCYRPEHCL